MLIEHIYEWARSQPTKPAIISNDVSLNYAAFARAIDAVRRFLQPHGLPSGRTAIVLGHSPVRAWTTVLALRSFGLTTVYVTSIKNAERLKLRNVAVVVGFQPELNAHRLEAKTWAGVTVLTVPMAIYANIHDGELPFIESNGPFGGHITHTSGTTGSSKKLLLDSAFEDQRHATRARVDSFSKNTIANVPSELSNGSAVKSAGSVWHVGGCVVTDWRPNSLSRILRHGVNWLKFPPALFRKAIRLPDILRQIDDDCELVIGGGFLSVKLAEEAISRLRRGLVMAYGASELGATPLLSRFTSTDDMHWLAPSEGRIVEVVDEDGNKCPEGELRILLTELDCTSYLDDEETSATVFRNGFFYPGDMALRRSDGRIRILGRVDDVLNVQGKKYPVAPIEQVIQQELGVDEVCVFSGLNAAGNEELAVAIESSRQLSRSELEAVTRQCAPFELIRVTVFKEFPRKETGTRKTRRSVLRKLVFGETPVRT